MSVQWKLVPQWLFWQARKGWITVLVLPFSGVSGYWLAGLLQSPNIGETTFRLSGLLLQFGGLIVVAVGLHSTQKQFNAPGVTGRVKKWISEGSKLLKDPPSRQNGEPISLQLRLSVIDKSVRLGKLTPNQSIEEKLSTLAENQSRIASELERHGETTEGLINQIQIAVSSEEHNRLREVGSLRDELRNFSTGGLTLEWMGLIWLLFGTAFGTMSPELGGVINRLTS